MTVKEILSCLAQIAPLSWQESYDNAGLQIGDENAEVKKALIALDITEALVDEAVAKSCNLIISHHPLIFRGLKHLTPKSPIERAVVKAIKNEIAIISMHTNLDNSALGVNCRLGEMLGLKNLRILQPMGKMESQNEIQLAGSGMIGEFETEISEMDFLNLVSETIGTPCLRHSALTGRMIKRVALCGGAGSFLMGDAKCANADAFLSADMKYHEFFEPDGDILLVDGGHFETEQFTKELIRDLIQKKFATFAAEIAETNTNSVHYFVKSK